MTLQDMNNIKHKDRDLVEQNRLVGRREPADRQPKKAEEQAQRLEALTELVRDARANGDSLTGRRVC